MPSSSQNKSWIGRNIWYFIVGAPLLYVVLAPFPGLGMIYPVWDNLRGHPQGPHGTQPANFVGLWIREDPDLYNFVGQAFYLLPDGRFAGNQGMTRRRWHFDRNCFFVDTVSLCGNCYRGNVTSEHTVKFVGADRMLVTDKNQQVRQGIDGMYRKVEITEALKSELNLLKNSENDDESFKARQTVQTIEQFEFLTKSKR